MDPKSNVEDDESAGSASATAEAKKKPNFAGPKPGVQYPLNVMYCGGNHFWNKIFIFSNYYSYLFNSECNLPVDLCEYSQNPDACKDWLEKNHPDFYTKLNELKSMLFLYVRIVLIVLFNF